MNIPIVLSRLGLLSIVLSTIMLVMTGIFYLADLLGPHQLDPSAARGMIGAGAAGALIGVGLWGWYRNRGSGHLGRREALLLVALSWIGGAALAGLPFWLWATFNPSLDASAPFRSFISAYFEAMSGLTTTGATVLSDIEQVPRVLLLWRSLTHWLGGIGIVVLFVAVLPGLGVGGKRLFQVESPGPAPEGLQPHIRQTARYLWYIYLGFTAAEITLLVALTPMGLFDAVCHTFATLATGGFSTHNASLGHYHDSLTVDIIVIIFMVLAGMNFGLYYAMLRGRWRELIRDPELRFYLGLLTVGSMIVVFALIQAREPIMLTNGTAVEPTIGESIRQGVLTTVSIQTTTGFATSDFNAWPFIAHAVLIGLMFVGGCSGSTGGGIKVIRIWVAIKVMVAEIEHIFRPQVIRPVRIGNKPVDPDLKLATIAYVLGIVILFAFGSTTIMAIESAYASSDCDFQTAGTAAIATLCTIGPGLGGVGAVENYGWFSGPSKLVMCILMALGRLEVFAIIVLFTPRFWRGT